MNRYVPQSVMTPEGEVLDIHIVLNEMFKSGDKLFVEYSDGPIAYKARSASDHASILTGLTTTTAVFVQDRTYCSQSSSSFGKCSKLLLRCPAGLGSFRKLRISCCPVT